ncbi:MAG: hypothetical protein K6G19_02220 [Lachnospiraceae bacterium]|nr:hypothetical protein [Lachnospiraceae bacterium]
MLFAKKKKLRFDEMEHIESPDLSELEASLDFLKKTPEKKDDEDSSAVLHPMPAIEPPKLDQEKKTADKEDDKSSTSSPAEQDIAFDDVSDDVSDDKAEADRVSTSTDISEEIIKKAETLRKKQLINDSVNSEAELALKKDEANITKSSDESVNMPQKEVSDAVKAAMALQAEYEAKKSELLPEDLRKRSRFMRARVYPVNKTAVPVAEKTDSNRSEADRDGAVQYKSNEDKNDADLNEADIKSKASEIPVDSTEKKACEKEETVNDNAELTPAITVENADDAADSKKEAVYVETQSEKTEDSDSRESKTVGINTNNDDSRKNDVQKAGVKTEEKNKDKDIQVKKSSSSTAITSNLRLPNDVIVSNIESSARSMGKYAGAAKIANPLPHPKKHITRNMDFDYPVSAAQMHFDIEDLNGMDFFDIDD